VPARVPLCQARSKIAIATPPPFAAQRPCLESASSRLFISLPSYPRRITSLSFYYPFHPPRSTAMTCPSDNSQAFDQSSFWSVGMHWDTHRIGWAIAGGCSTLVRAISLCPKPIELVSHSPDCRLYSSLLLLSSTTVGMPPSCVHLPTRELTYPSNYTKPQEQRQMYVRPSTILQVT
jgi:hypothetical protein